MSNDPKVRQLFIPCSSAEAADGYEVEPFTSTGLKICSTGLTETELMFLCEHARVPTSPSAYPKKSPVLIRVATLQGVLWVSFPNRDIWSGNWIRIEYRQRRDVCPSVQTRGLHYDIELIMVPVVPFHDFWKARSLDYGWQSHTKWKARELNV